MKKLLVYIFICFSLIGCNFLKNTKEKKFKLNKSNSDLVGAWEFVGRLDKDGNKIDTIWYGKVWEVASGPLITFYQNGTYSKKFTPKNTDTGKWVYNSKKELLILFLYIDSTDWIGKDLIKRNMAVKHKDNEYYEELEYKILRLTPDTLQYLDYSGRNMIYKKIK